MATLAMQRMRAKARTRTIDHILSGNEYIVSHDNTSQYALGGPSSCGIVAMNCIRHVLSLEKDGCIGEDLVATMTEKDIVDVRWLRLLSILLYSNDLCSRI